ncbi:MAG: hypothetical protein KatS3mg060_0689 [Dehalococcoidia bacterium]|nr:MAG: hypothetical protein KatS3mg060_0689 [Dehalococcoidia bacterium]
MNQPSVRRLSAPEGQVGVNSSADGSPCLLLIYTDALFRDVICHALRAAQIEVGRAVHAAEMSGSLLAAVQPTVVVVDRLPPEALVRLLALAVELASPPLIVALSLATDRIQTIETFAIRPAGLEELRAVLLERLRNG